MEIETFKIRSGHTVYAKSTQKYGVVPVSYTNEKQAKKRAEELTKAGINCHVRAMRPFYIIID